MKDQSNDRQRLDRRSFVKASLVPAALAIPDGPAMRPAQGAEPPPEEPAAVPEIIDSNVHLFEWPFRKLKYDRTEALIAKLRRHRITQAWAGSFEAVLHKQLDAVNRRLAEECRDARRRAADPHRQRQPGLARLGGRPAALSRAIRHARACGSTRPITATRSITPSCSGCSARRPSAGCWSRSSCGWKTSGCIIRRSMAPVVNASPLLDVLKKVPAAKVQLINADTVFRAEQRPGPGRARRKSRSTSPPSKGNGGVGRLIDGDESELPGCDPRGAAAVRLACAVFPVRKRPDEAVRVAARPSSNSTR